MKKVLFAVLAVMLMVIPAFAGQGNNGNPPGQSDTTTFQWTKSVDLNSFNYSKGTFAGASVDGAGGSGALSMGGIAIGSNFTTSNAHAAGLNGCQGSFATAAGSEFSISKGMVFGHGLAGGIGGATYGAGAEAYKTIEINHFSLDVVKTFSITVPKQNGPPR